MSPLPSSEERPREVSRGTARMLHNVADAADPAWAGRDLASGVAVEVRHRGPGAARALWFWLTWLEWEPVLRVPPAARFWRLGRDARHRALARWAASRWPQRRAAWSRLRAALERSAAAAPLAAQLPAELPAELSAE